MAKMYRNIVISLNNRLEDMLKANNKPKKEEFVREIKDWLSKISYELNIPPDVLNNLKHLNQFVALQKNQEIKGERQVGVLLLNSLYPNFFEKEFVEIIDANVRFNPYEADTNDKLELTEKKAELTEERRKLEKQKRKLLVTIMKGSNDAKKTTKLAAELTNVNIRLQEVKSSLKKVKAELNDPYYTGKNLPPLPPPPRDTDEEIDDEQKSSLDELNRMFDSMVDASLEKARGSIKASRRSSKKDTKTMSGDEVFEWLSSDENPLARPSAKEDNNAAMERLMAELSDDSSDQRAEESSGRDSKWDSGVEPANLDDEDEDFIPLPAIKPEDIKEAVESFSEMLNETCPDKTVQTADEKTIKKTRKMIVEAIDNWVDTHFDEDNANVLRAMQKKMGSDQDEEYGQFSKLEDEGLSEDNYSFLNGLSPDENVYLFEQEFNNAVMRKLAFLSALELKQFQDKDSSRKTDTARAAPIVHGARKSSDRESLIDVASISTPRASEKRRLSKGSDSTSEDRKHKDKKPGKR